MLSWKSCLLVIGLFVTSVLHLSAADSISLDSLLNEMVDRNRVAIWPDPEYKAALAGSYDRASKTPDDPKCWFANADNSDGIAKSMCCITNDGRDEWILVDIDGPGCITRFWTGGKHAVGNIRFYLDGAKESVITAQMQDLLCGRGFVPKPLAIEDPKDAGNLYLPIPYAGHCMVTYDEKSKNPGNPPNRRWWNVEYRTYASGTRVKTFTMEDFKTVEPLISRICKDLLEQNPTVEGKTSSLDKMIEPGKEASLDLPQGSAAVRSIELSFGSDQPQQINQALRSTVLRMSFDGTETVWCPVGDFFGSGHGPELAPVCSWYRSVDKSGKLSCRWVMPYRTSARVGVLNSGGMPVNIKMDITTGALKWTDKSMYFHANWHQQRDIPTRPFSDWNYLMVKGEGIYLGDTLTVFNPSDKWWGEGDEKIWVDNGSFPGHFGTGSEDYYGYAWGCPIRFQGPFCNQPYIQRGNAGYTVNTRTRSLDAIPFTKSLKFDMEIWHWQDCKVDYAVATYWYAFPGATCNRSAEPEEVKKPLRDLPPEEKAPAPVPLVQGAIECENMKILSSSEGLDISKQSNIKFPKGRWSCASQLFVKAKKNGDFVELLVGDKIDGPGKVVLHATRSYDYGILRFSINGKPAGGDFDGYAEQSDLSGPVELGVFEPRDGRIVLRIEVIGTNMASKGNRHFFGLDCITLNKI